jgi:hypothetical protein
MKVQLLWFRDCANHQGARTLIRQVLMEKGLLSEVEEVEITDADVAEHHRFPGSPTIRVNGRDVDPAFEDEGDYTLRCRVYATDAGLTGVPLRTWIEDAVEAARG